MSNLFNSPKAGHNFCRLAQGEKTAYDGKGQPVPGGVKVEVTFKLEYMLPITETAGSVDWKYVDTYKIQEQKLDKPVSEHPLTELAENQEDLPVEFSKAVDENFFDLSDGSLWHEGKTFEEITENPAIGCVVHLHEDCLVQAEQIKDLQQQLDEQVAYGEHVKCVLKKYSSAAISGQAYVGYCLNKNPSPQLLAKIQADAVAEFKRVKSEAGLEYPEPIDEQRIKDLQQELDKKIAYGEKLREAMIWVVNHHDIVAETHLHLADVIEAVKNPSPQLKTKRGAEK
ncbi:MAG: hypothetical protein COB23_03100 [Methylophaga sp.]|nr:MAG: hypothetical protein COB23_03100 [Methylophaga sp.]